MDDDPVQDDPMDDDPMQDHPTQDHPMQDDPMDAPMHDDEVLDEQALDRALSDADEALSSQLRELLDPDAGLTERTAQDIDRSLRGRSGLTAALDLLGLGWWTAKAVLGDGGAARRADDRHGIGNGDPRTLSADLERADPEGEGT